MKTGRIALLATVVAVLALAGTSTAGTIFLSGDTNIVNVISQPGNTQFFSNVLQGGSQVAILDFTDMGYGVAGNADNELNAFYNSLSGVSSNIFAGAVTGAQLAGVDLLVAILPDDPFSAGEIGVMHGFLASGGTIFFMGENNNPVFANPNNAINAALAGLGSGMSIVPDLFDAGFQNTFNIAVDPFTAGVASIRYAAPSRTAGGTPIVFGLEDEPFIAYESTIRQVPEPTTLLLLGVGLAGIWNRRRRLS